VCAPSEQLPATCLLGLARATTKQMLNPNTSLQLHGSQVIRFRIHQSWTPGVFFEQKKDMHQTSFSILSEKRQERRLLHYEKLKFTTYSQNFTDEITAYIQKMIPDQQH
jgi:hypothetical protein